MVELRVWIPAHGVPLQVGLRQREGDPRDESDNADGRHEEAGALESEYVLPCRVKSDENNR